MAQRARWLGCPRTNVAAVLGSLGALRQGQHVGDASADKGWGRGVSWGGLGLFGLGPAGWGRWRCASVCVADMPVYRSGWQGLPAVLDPAFASWLPSCSSLPASRSVDTGQGH